MRTLWHDLTDGAPWYRKVAFAWLAIAAVLAVLGILAFFSRFLSVFGWWGLLGYLTAACFAVVMPPDGTGPR